MRPLRQIAAANGSIMALLIALTLAVRVLIPVGYMPSFDQGRLTLTLCSVPLPAPAAPAAMAGMNGHDGGHAMHASDPADDEPSHHGGSGPTETPCDYTNLTLAPLQTVAPPVLADRLVAPTPFTPPALAAPRPADPGRLRPPSRAPPLVA